MSARRQAFYVSTAGLVVFRFMHDSLIEVLTFAADDAGRGDFARYLAKAGHETACMLVDLPGEELHAATVPHVYAAERNELLARHAARYFPAAQLRAAQVQGRESDGRRDDRVLFAAITHQEAMLPWLQALEEAHTPLASIGSVPLVTGSFARRLAIADTHALLVSCHAGAGLRQTFLQHGEVRFSRLSSLPSEAPAQCASRIQEEITLTARYLHRMQFLPEASPLALHVLASAARPVTSASDDLTIQHDLLTMAKRLRLSAPVPDDVRILYAYVLVQQNNERFYATATHTRYHRALRVRTLTHRLLAGTLAVAALGVVAKILEWGAISPTEQGADKMATSIAVRTKAFPIVIDELESGILKPDASERRHQRVPTRAPVPESVQDPPVPESEIIFQGVVSRLGSHERVWINDQYLDADKLPAGLRLVLAASGDYVLEIETSEGVGPVLLKPGERWQGVIATHRPDAATPAEGGER